MRNRISIYGAQIIATSIYRVLTELLLVEVSYFIVSEKEGNPSSLYGIKVVSIEDYIEISKNQQLDEDILIATPIEHHTSIANILDQYNCHNYIKLLSKDYNVWMEKYYSQCSDLLTWNKLILEDSRADEGSMKTPHHDFRVYMARSIKDRELRKEVIENWVIPIQAGADLDVEKWNIVGDNAGDSISVRNRDYCELTVLYWLWKNSRNRYMGLCHYRRIFELDEIRIKQIIQQDIDIVLPYPTIHYPNIKEQYKRYISKELWDLMCEIVLEKHPNLGSLWEDIWRSEYFYNYNMLIGKEGIVKEYCNWLYQILFTIENEGKRRNIIPSKRYAGYMGEILETIYFRFYRNDITILHLGVTILF